MDKKNLLKLKRLGITTAAALLLASLGGCAKEQAVDMGSIDLLETNGSEDGKSLNKGITQRKEVNGESFNLLINYTTEERAWTITDRKELYIEIKTENLPDNLSVYIDNIHCDTSIVCSNAIFKGIKQDTMDDHVHSSLLYGFPIDNEHSYFGVNVIEGQNSEFIQGFMYGNNYYTSGSVTQKRRLESDYLKAGVWANEIDSIIDLLIVDKTTNKVLRQVSVPSNLLVEVNDKITFLENGYEVTYDYDRDGSRTEIKKVKKID